MFKEVLFILFTCLTVSAMAQVQTQLVGDSVFIHSNAGKGELILQNRTDSVKGFLFNKGDGRTEFRSGLIRLNNHVYLVGNDTLVVDGGTSLKNIYYVSRQFTGAARAVVSGYTLASITSTNDSYNDQLTRATAGSMALSYPDPFSARNAAMDAIVAGTINSADIIIMEGSSYTIGSDDSTKNGDLTGLNPNNETVADIQFSSAVLSADQSISSIMKNRVNMYFSGNTSLTYINSDYPVYCYYEDDDNNGAFQSGVYGWGNFYQVYGEVNGFIAAFSFMNNRSARVDFHAQEVVLQQYNCFVFAEYDVYNIAIDNLTMADSQGFFIGKPLGGVNQVGSLTNSSRQLHIKVNNFRFGKGQIPYPDSDDYWYPIQLGSNTALEGTMVTIDIGNLYLKNSKDGGLFYIKTHALLYNLNLTVNISNLVQRGSYVHSKPLGSGLIDCYSTDVAINNTITYNIHSANIEAPLLGFISFSAYSSNINNKNNHLNINVGELQKISSPAVGSLFQITSQLSLRYGEPLNIKISGNYTSNDNKPVIEIFNTYHSLPYACKYQFSGKYETTTNIPVAHFYTNAERMVSFTDVLLINRGNAPVIFADSVCTGFRGGCPEPAGTPIHIPVYIKNVHATTAPGNNIQLFGDEIKVVPEIMDFL